MLPEPLHITLTLQNAEEFESLLTFLEGAECKMERMNQVQLTVVCYVDDFILCLVKKYVNPFIIYHNYSLTTNKTPFISGHIVHKAAGQGAIHC